MECDENFNYSLKDDLARRELERGYDKAEETLNDEDKMERFLQHLEKKLKTIPVAGDRLADVPIMASLVRSYLEKGVY